MTNTCSDGLADRRIERIAADPGLAAADRPAGARVLITGGAGFIGSHLADELLAHGYRVRALDILEPQVHGDRDGRPPYLAPEVDLRRGDVRHVDDIEAALMDVDAVIHLAAAVGVGQSMYRIGHYVGVNDVGTAQLMDCLARRPVQRLVVASSMSVYGEGLYLAADGRPVSDVRRDPERLRAGAWEPHDALGRALRPVPTPESKPPALASVYALSKFMQERLCLLVGEAYGIATTALRFFNVYGPRQELSNPYTGVLAIFGARLLNDRPPLVFEDGGQQRDLVHVQDVARACRLALERPAAAGQVINIGSGTSCTVREVARLLARALGKPRMEPHITGRYRVGDIRSCFADISRAQELLGYSPAIGLEQGIEELALWLAEQVAVDRVDEATAELARRGLVA